MCGCAIADELGAIAIRDAKIVTVSGAALNKGTVVIRKGLIEAVGENVQIPSDAWIVDGAGLTVYPGLIDPLSTVGIPGAAPTQATGGRGGGRGQIETPTPPAATTPTSAPARGPEDRPNTTSWVLAADEIQTTDPRIETVRSAGYTTTVTYPERGIFAGQGSIIDLAATEHSGEMVVMPAVGQYISLARAPGAGFGSFPSSLMGYIGYLRQIYLDADHYQLAKEAYARDPRSVARPAYDRALEGVLASKRILLPANRVVEMDRMLRLAAELKQPAILYGMREGYRPEAAALLKKFTAPVLVSLKWSEAPKDPDPEADQTLRSLQNIDQGPATPALLHKAGVTFALYADGIDQRRDLVKAVRKALEAGLAREDAIRAMTLTPAEMYGVADRLGSVEKGKIANLVVTKGELFDTNTHVEMIFVDGKQYKPAPEPPPGGGHGQASEEPGVIQ